MQRIGIGYDIHRLVKGRDLFLGGIKIPSGQGLLGHSDGDVLLHAICDAILGALGRQDIGDNFPDTSRKYKDISSIVLLKEVAKMMKRDRYAVSNIDSVVIAERPKLTKYKDAMRKQVARTLGIEPLKVQIKAKTNEGLGDLGRGKAIAAYAAVILSKIR